MNGAQVANEFAVATAVAPLPAARKKRPRAPVPQASLAAGLLAVPFLFFFVSFGYSPSVAIPLSILLGLTGSRFITSLLDPREDLFSPVLMVAGYFAVDHGLRAVYILPPISGRPLGLVSYEDYLPQGLWCAVLAYCCFLAGFNSSWGNRLRATLPSGEMRWPRRVPAIQILILLAIGMAAALYLLKIGAMVHGVERSTGGSPVPGIFVALCRLVAMAWIIICLYRFSRGRIRDRGLVLLLLLISICCLAGYVAMTGGKQALFEPFLAGLVVFHYMRKRLKLWQVLALAIPAILVGFGAVNFYRFAIVGQSTAPRDIAEIFDRVSTAADRLQTGQTGRKSAIEQMMERQAGIDAMSLILKFTPNPNPFAYGKPFIRAAVAAFVPRQIWRDKPVYTPSREFERDYLGMPGFYDGHSSTHLVPDLYHNFALPGVILGMIALGVIYRFFYVVCSPSPGNPVGVFCYAVFLPQFFHYMEGNLGYAIVEVPRLIALVVAVLVFVGVRHRQSRQRRGVPLRSGEINPQPFVGGLPRIEREHQAV